MVEAVTIDGWCTLYHADNAEIVDVLREHGPDAVITDPVWPNCPEGLLHGWNYPHKLMVDMVGALPESIKRLVVILRSDSDPRFLCSISHDWPFFNAHWLQYVMPGYLGRKLGGNEIAYAFGQPIPRREGQVVIPSVAPKSQPGDRPAVGHPCSRSLSHMQWLVEWWSEAGETIYDPFMGSATTALAAFRHGRKFVGVEIDRRWFDVAVERIKRQAGNGPLFERAKALEQIPLTV